jgi:hypothetical protein
MTRAKPKLSIYDATEVLFTNRHRLPSDILRTLANIYTCASGAKYGAPHETWWMEPEFFENHDAAYCEAEGYPNAERKAYWAAQDAAHAQAREDVRRAIELGQPGAWSDEPPF